MIFSLPPGSHDPTLPRYLKDDETEPTLPRTLARSLARSHAHTLTCSHASTLTRSDFFYPWFFTFYYLK